MASSMLEQMTPEQVFLVKQAMEEMDRHYDEAKHMLRNAEDGRSEWHSTRGSAHYAVGLLIRNGEGDVERACAVLDEVLNLQFDAPDEIFHGTFKTSPQAADPPRGGYPWKRFGPGFAYYVTSMLEKISDHLAEELGAEPPALPVLLPPDAFSLPQAAANSVSTATKPSNTHFLPLFVLPIINPLLLLFLMTSINITGDERFYFDTCYMTYYKSQLRSTISHKFSIISEIFSRFLKDILSNS